MTDSINIQQGSGVRCPYCNGHTRVTNTIPKPEESVMGRYRACVDCDKRFYTEEFVVKLISPIDGEGIENKVNAD